jgi:signal transduction histidine kinase
LWALANPNEIFAKLIEMYVAFESDGEMFLSVSDRGIGILDADKKLVFEKFYRIGNEETRKAIGTGLGLYIVKQVVHAHGGRISLTDNKPQGTVFMLEL